ncbi:putative zinc finger [Lyophyllum shimeji]|uniref:Zinc finger n=1 Tax=Lyophyllum shimeji TaxID=47721 RepID=A0A9P3PK54_LYOSH|nr:putative zinc finger [Lyophyllum shimeji]
MAEPQPELLHPFNQANEEEDEEEEEEWDDEEYEEGDDDDIDAEAEEIARRLGEELWADLHKVNAVQGAGVAPPFPATSPVPAAAMETIATVPTTAIPAPSRKGEAAIITMKAILAVVENDLPARSALASTIVPESNGENVLETLRRLVALGDVPKSTAVALSPVLVSLARSDILFGNLRHSNASSIQLDRGKRKREEADEGGRLHDPRTFKRPYVPESDLLTRVNEAVRVITQSLGSSPDQPLDASLVSSIRLHLHQVFLFAVTSSAGGGRDMHALQEIGGLIQVIGVLSSIQIGQPPESHSRSTPLPSNPSYPWLPPPHPASATDIGTAVYPCLMVGCKKIFSRLFSLRAHQRVHAAHRPHRCNICPASFARNHDLKRHFKLHEKKAWKCGGCHKVFSRRDAIKRHKTGSKNRGPRSEACLAAEIIEVELDEEAGEESMREERRAKLWNGIAAAQADVAAAQPLPPPGYHGPSGMEEGEVRPETIAAIQSSVLSLHGLLQTRVGGALGTPAGQHISTQVDPTAGQATLASVIARAQLQNMTFRTATLDASGVDPATAAVAVDGAVSSTDQAPDVSTAAGAPSEEAATPIPSLSMYGLSDEQTKMLEEAIANAASAAQAQAEAEAALEEEEEDDEDFDDDDDDSEGHPDMERSS